MSVYNVCEKEVDPECDEKLLQNNIYDATPDHSILKHGMAKSLSNFHLGMWMPLIFSSFFHETV